MFNEVLYGDDVREELNMTDNNGPNFNFEINSNHVFKL